MKHTRAIFISVVIMLMIFIGLYFLSGLFTMGSTNKTTHHMRMIAKNVAKYFKVYGAMPSSYQQIKMIDPNLDVNDGWGDPMIYAIINDTVESRLFEISTQYDKSSSRYRKIEFSIPSDDDEVIAFLNSIYCFAADNKRMPDSLQELVNADYLVHKQNGIYMLGPSTTPSKYSLKKCPNDTPIKNLSSVIINYGGKRDGALLENSNREMMSSIEVWKMIRDYDEKIVDVIGKNVIPATKPSEDADKKE